MPAGLWPAGFSLKVRWHVEVYGFAGSERCQGIRIEIAVISSRKCRVVAPLRLPQKLFTHQRKPQGCHPYRREERAALRVRSRRAILPSSHGQTLTGLPVAPSTSPANTLHPPEQKPRVPSGVLLIAYERHGLHHNGLRILMRLPWERCPVLSFICLDSVHCAKGVHVGLTGELEKSRGGRQ